MTRDLMAYSILFVLLILIVLPLVWRFLYPPDQLQQETDALIDEQEKRLRKIYGR
jgi:hypothetical protein